MIRGNLVRITRDHLEFSPDLLRPLNIRPGVAVTGIYNPPPETGKDAESYANVTLRDDFVFTPIPYGFWPFLARLTVYMDHSPGSLFRISEALEEAKVNILVATATRFGYRCAQWSLVIEFEEVRLQYRENPNNPEIAGKIKEGIKLLDTKINLLNDRNGHILFEDRVVEQAVFGRQLKMLARFHSQVLKAQTDPVNLRGKVFSGSCEGNSININHESWLDIIDTAFVEENISEEEPCYGLASLDTGGYLFRVAAIRKEALPRFRIIEIAYKRTTMRASGVLTSQGLLLSIARKLREENLWRVENMTEVNRPNREEGVVELVIECMTEKEDYEGFFSRLQTSLESISSPGGLELAAVKIHKIENWMRQDL